MSRFNLNLPVKPSGTVKIGEGTEYEVEFIVPPPIGERWDNELIPALMRKTQQFYNLRNIGDGNDDEQIQAVVDMTSQMNEVMDKGFYDLLKIVLDIESEPDALPYLEKYFPKMRIMELFAAAVEKITVRAFGGEEVTDALGKLNGDEVEVVQ